MEKMRKIKQKTKEQIVINKKYKTIYTFKIKYY